LARGIDFIHRSFAKAGSLPFLWFVSGLSVGVEIDFIDACLSRGAWLGVPRISAQLDLAELLYGETAPLTRSFWHPG